MDVRAGASELERLAQHLVPPCPAGPYTLTSRVARTSNALVFTATGGDWGQTGGVLKVAGSHFVPLLERELRLLVRCRDEGVEGVIRPAAADLIALHWPDAPLVAAAIALPLLSGGDLAEVARAYATRSGRLSPDLALQAGRRLLAVQRGLLALERPIVHGDVKLQNVLLPAPDAPLSALTVIDLDSARELDFPLAHLAAAPPAAAAWLAEDVRAFGDLLAQLASGQEGAAQNEAWRSGNTAFDTLVARCLRSFPGDGAGYVCLADEGLRFDLQQALDVQGTAGASARPGPRTGQGSPLVGANRLLAPLTRLRQRLPNLPWRGRG